MREEFEGYLIDEAGFVWNQKQTAPLKGKIIPEGYQTVTLKIEGKKKDFRVHRLVAEFFVPNANPMELTYVRHKDGNKLNNAASNLEWVGSWEMFKNTPGKTKEELDAIRTSMKKTTRILNTITGEIHEFESRAECCRHFGAASFVSITGSEKLLRKPAKKFKHLKEIE